MKQPHLQIGEGDINKDVLLPGDPDRVDVIAGYLDSFEELTQNREYHLINGEYMGKPLSVCSTGVGSPSAAIAVEELVEVGAESLIRVGTTGALQREINNGDIIS